MPLSADWIEKPLPVTLIDQFFSGSAEALNDAYDFARSLLDQDDPLDETTAALAGQGPGPLADLTQGDAEHFRAHWLDPEHPEHPWSGEEVDAIMRDAYRYAIDIAQEHDPPLPIETFWVFTSIDRFEMRVSEGDRQISVFALIPKTAEIVFGELPPGAKPIQRFPSTSTD